MLMSRDRGKEEGKSVEYKALFTSLLPLLGNLWMGDSMVGVI